MTPRELAELVTWLGVALVAAGLAWYGWRVNQEIRYITARIGKAKTVCGTCLRRANPQLVELMDHLFTPDMDHEWLPCALLELPDLTDNQIAMIVQNRAKFYLSHETKEKGIE